MRQVERDIVAHTQQLRKENTRIVVHDTLLIQQLRQTMVALLVVRTHKHLEVIQVIHRIFHSRIVVVIRSLLVFADRIGITHLGRTCALLFHVSATHKLHTGDVVLLHSVFIDPLQIRHTIVAIHLQRRENDRTLLVKLTHSLIRQLVNRILETVILGIHQDTHIIVIRTLAEGHEAIAELTELLYLLNTQLTPLLRSLCQQIIRGDRGGLEHSVSQVGITFREINRTHRLLESSLDAIGCLLALRREIKR